MRFIFAFVTSALLASAPAFAADDSGFYIGAGIGDGSVTVDIDEASDFDGSDTAFKVFGGYKFMKYVGVELEYIDAGDAEDKWSESFEGISEELKVTIGFSGFNASAVGILPIGEKFNVFGKLGFMMWDADLRARYSFDGFSDSESDSDSGTDFSWGVGAGFDFTDNLGVRVEYQAFEIEDADADLFSGSVVWMF